MGNWRSKGGAVVDRHHHPAAADESPREPYRSPPPQSCSSSSSAMAAAAAAAAARRSKAFKTDSVTGRGFSDIAECYALGAELGRGQFGVTRLATRKSDSARLAVKTIAKRKLRSSGDVEDVRREVQIMHHLSGHDHIVELQDVYEDRNSVHLVMELCEGGELFDRIIERGHYTERAAAALCRTMVQVIQICHSLGVMHRDLKPENFLFASRDEDADLKTTDFGLSVFFKHGETFQDLVGSAFYVAPEVLKRTYGPEADVWSAGVILYILLSGVPPFWAETDQGIFSAILQGYLDLSSDPWPKVSEGAKDLIRKMLNYEPKERLSPEDVLKHPWLKEDGEAPDKPMDTAVLSRMKQFSAMNKLKKLALKVIAESLSEEEIMGLKSMFESMDADHSGSITLDELKTGLAKLGSNLAESEVEHLMKAADVDGNGSIDYMEFITATMHMNKMEKEDHLYAAFQYFDKDNSGYITVEELEQALGEHKMQDLQDIIQEVDADNDGRIDYDEFVAMMRGGLNSRRDKSVASSSS